MTTKIKEVTALAIQASAKENGLLFGKHVGEDVVLGWAFSKNRQQTLITKLSQKVFSEPIQLFTFVKTGINSFLPNELYVSDIEEIIFNKQGKYFDKALTLVPNYYTDEFKDKVNVLFKLKNMKLVNKHQYNEYSYVLANEPEKKFDIENFFDTMANIAALASDE